MDYETLIDRLSPELVERLRRGIETGRWPDGKALTEEQRAHSLQAIIAWDARHKPESERVGFIDKGAKADKSSSTEGEAALRWVQEQNDHERSGE